jgi:hypothetical protein
MGWFVGVPANSGRTGGIVSDPVTSPETLAHDARTSFRHPQASHADPRTTMRYDRARVSRDRHATYIVAAFLAGAAR